MMDCKHCGKTLPKNAKYCPNCAEPTNINSSYLENTSEKNLSNALAKRFIKGVAILLLPSVFIAFMISDFNNAIPNFWGYFFSTFIFGLIFVIVDIMLVRNNDRKSNILIQFETDKTSICPMCGSHSIKIYRKGYNYNEAFWGSVFKIRGTRYTAGMDSNNAMCYCEHCGHTWNSGHDYRTLK